MEKSLFSGWRKSTLMWKILFWFLLKKELGSLLKDCVYQERNRKKGNKEIPCPKQKGKGERLGNLANPPDPPKKGNKKIK